MQLENVAGNTWATKIKNIFSLGLPEETVPAVGIRTLAGWEMPQASCF